MAENCSESKQIEGIPFGSARRVLPVSLENEILSFCSLEDISAFSLTSHALAAQAVRYLRLARLISVTVLSDPTKDTSIGLKLAAQHCRQLQTLGIGDADHKRCEPSRKWLCRMLERNTATFRRLQFAFLSSSEPQTDQSMRLLMRCPLLEYVDIRYSISSDVIKGINSSLWPNLRSALLVAEVQGRLWPWQTEPETTKPEHLGEVLERGVCACASDCLTGCMTGFAPSLTSLQFEHVMPYVLPKFSGLQFTALRALSLQFDSVVETEPQLTILLSNTRCLTDLSLTFRIPWHRMDEPVRNDERSTRAPPIWSLPQLRVFKLSDFPWLPLLKAPVLERIYIKTASKHSSNVKQALWPTMLGSERLTTVVVCGEVPTDLSDFACSLFAQELLTGRWPGLETIELFPMCASTAILQALIKRPRPKLQSLFSGDLQSIQQACDVLSAHPRLQAAHLRKLSPMSEAKASSAKPSHPPERPLQQHFQPCWPWLS